MLPSSIQLYNTGWIRTGVEVVMRAGVPGARSKPSSVYLLMIRNLRPGELFDNSSVNPSVLTAIYHPFLYPCLDEGNVNVSSCFRASETYRATKWKRISAIKGHYEQCPEQSNQSWSDLSSCTQQGRQDGHHMSPDRREQVVLAEGFHFGKMYEHTVLWLLCVWPVFEVLPGDRCTSCFRRCDD